MNQHYKNTYLCNESRSFGRSACGGWNDRNRSMPYQWNIHTGMWQACADTEQELWGHRTHLFSEPTQARMIRFMFFH
jgi:hypothetical protein